MAISIVVLVADVYGKDVRPANATGVARLLDPRWLVEIEAEAVKE